jgi:hypothetical protein
MRAKTDTDWGGDKATRKSVTCGVLLVGGCPQGHFVRDQKLVLQSSGEAEFAGGGAVANEAVGLAGVYQEMGIDLEVYLEFDSTAAMGMCTRRGVGKVRHMDIRFLVLQDWLRLGVITALVKVDTDTHVADLGTKHHPADRMHMLLGLMGTKLIGDETASSQVACTKARQPAGPHRHAHLDVMSNVMLQCAAALSALSGVGAVEFTAQGDVCTNVPTTSFPFWLTSVFWLCTMLLATALGFWLGSRYGGRTRSSGLKVERLADSWTSTSAGDLERQHGGGSIQGPQRAFMAQGCMRCWEQIEKGDWITKFQEGWCHSGCQLQVITNTRSL